MKFILFANENKRKKGKKNTKIQKVKIVSLLKDRNDYVCLRVSETTLYFFFFYFFSFLGFSFDGGNFQKMNFLFLHEIFANIYLLW